MSMPHFSLKMAFRHYYSPDFTLVCKIHEIFAGILKNVLVFGLRCQKGIFYLTNILISAHETRHGQLISNNYSLATTALRASAARSGSKGDIIAFMY